jgi:iron complex transport system ATP-binding protein
MIEVKNIAFSYGKHTVLKDISFTAEPGDCVSILGNNGVGKSTLVTCINKIRKPDHGSVLINGKSIFDMSRQELARNVAYVAQKNEMSQTTVYDAILLGRKPYMTWGMNSADYALCDEMMERVGMTAFKLRNVNELSGGEAQKVMLARAFVQQPKLLLLDEPTSNLDPRNQYEMMKLVCQIAREQGITVLVVIHDLNLALRYCNRFLFIKDGEVYDYGDESVVTENALLDVYGINASLITYDNKKLAIIE